jgi:hypothetical protein
MTPRRVKMTSWEIIKNVKYLATTERSSLECVKPPIYCESPHQDKASIFGTNSTNLGQPSHDDRQEKAEESGYGGWEHTGNKLERILGLFIPRLEERDGGPQRIQIGKDGNDQEWHSVEETDGEEPHKAECTLPCKLCV